MTAVRATRSRMVGMPSARSPPPEPDEGGLRDHHPSHPRVEPEDLRSIRLGANPGLNPGPEAGQPLLQPVRLDHREALSIHPRCDLRPERVSPDYPSHPRIMVRGMLAYVPCPLPRRTRTGAHVGCFPVPRGLPHLTVGSPGRARGPSATSRIYGLLGLHSRYGPQACSPIQDGLYRKASVQPVTRPNRLLATRSNRQLSAWNPPPLVIRAVGAHDQVRA